MLDQNLTHLHRLLYLSSFVHKLFNPLETNTSLYFIS